MVTGANFDLSKVESIKICRQGLQDDDVWMTRTLGNKGCWIGRIRGSLGGGQ